MSLHRFYLPPEQWAHDLWLEGQEAKHLVQVLRLAPGEEVLLLDGQGRSGRFAIAETAKKKARLVLQEEQMAPAPESRAVMALAFSKAVRRGFFMERPWSWVPMPSGSGRVTTARANCLPMPPRPAGGSSSPEPSSAAIPGCRRWRP